ncbi:MAG: hypothetical protein AAF497_27080, partial [Planctomycetota bacterium]
RQVLALAVPETQPKQLHCAASIETRPVKSGREIADRFGTKTPFFNRLVNVTTTYLGVAKIGERLNRFLSLRR